MNAFITSTIVTGVYVPTFLVWLSAITAALVIPHYAIRLRVPWPVLATMILLLMVAATVTTLWVVWGFQA